jgi:hypothetical protein
MITVDGWATLWLNWPRSRRAFGGFSPIFRGPWNCQLRSSGATFSKAFWSRWHARLVFVRSYLSLKIFIGPTNRPSHW